MMNYDEMLKNGQLLNSERKYSCEDYLERKKMIYGVNLISELEMSTVNRLFNMIIKFGKPRLLS